MPFYKKYEPRLYVPMIKDEIDKVNANKRENQEEYNNEKQQ